MCRESKECLDEMVSSLTSCHCACVYQSLFSRGCLHTLQAQNLKEGYAEVAETCMDGTFHVIKNVKAILPCFNGAAAAATAADINQVGLPFHMVNQKH